MTYGEDKRTDRLYLLVMLVVVVASSASKVGKVTNFTKCFFLKGVDRFSKKLRFCNHSAFEWHASLVMTPPTPSNEPCIVLDRNGRF